MDSQDYEDADYSQQYSAFSQPTHYLNMHNSQTPTTNHAPTFMGMMTGPGMGSPFSFSPYQRPNSPNTPSNQVMPLGFASEDVNELPPMPKKKPGKHNNINMVDQENARIRKRGGSKNTKDEETNKNQKREVWKEPWVAQLIHIRGSMNDEFGRTPKQGIDLWSKIATQLSSLFPDCEKDSEACRKRWGRVYGDYKKDKAHNSISGNDRKVTCQWYEIVDEYMHGRANVMSYSHASAIGAKIGGGNVASEVEDQPTEFDASQVKENVVHEASVKRPRKDKNLEESLMDMADTAKLMATQQKESDIDKKAVEAQKLAMLGTLTSAVTGLMDVLKAFQKQ